MRVCKTQKGHKERSKSRLRKLSRETFRKKTTWVSSGNLAFRFRARSSSATCPSKPTSQPNVNFYPSRNNHIRNGHDGHHGVHHRNTAYGRVPPLPILHTQYTVITMTTALSCRSSAYTRARNSHCPETRPYEPVVAEGGGEIDRGEQKHQNVDFVRSTIICITVGIPVLTYAIIIIIPIPTEYWNIYVNNSNVRLKK